MKQILRGVFLFSILSLSILLVACQDEEPKTEFNVIFLDYDDNTISTQIVLLGEDAVEPKAPLIKGYQFVRWNQVFTNVERDLTIRPIYEANPYTISFNSQGGKELEDYSTFYDDEITNLPKPTREGYRFLGWYYQGEPIQLPFLYQYDENIRLDAKWEVGEEIYTITFQTHSELPVESLEVTRNDIISLTKPSRPGYLFSGWYYEDELVSVPFEFTFDHDITLEARWVELGYISYTITYQLFDDIVETNQVTAGETVSLLAPERSGYHFLGWYYLDMQVTEPFEFNYTHDITLVAKWEELTTYSIYLIDQDVSETILVMFGETIFLPAPDREHHFFLGWYDGDELINNSFVYHYDHDLTLEAKWEEEENFQLSFYTNGGTSIEGMKVFSCNTIYDLPIPSRNPDEFLGWYYHDKQIQIPFIYDFGKDITLEAKWLIRYHITFNTNGADPIETKWITPNQMIINLPLPTRQGHHFLGWFYDDDRIELPFSYTFDDNITLVAKWVERNEDFDYFISNNEVTITGYNADAPHVVIPTHIENHPVTSIGYQAFKDNTLIKTVQFPENSQLTTIYGSAFMGALNLESINLPNRLTTIGGNAFSDTPKLVSIHIPQGVERIQMNTFENSGIHHITFTEDSQLTIIDRLAFAGATNLSSIEVPSSVERIYDHAFYGANGLERMTLPFIGESLTGSRTDFGYIFGKTHYPGSYNANGYYLPNSLQEVVFTGGTLVDYNAFSGASSLRKIVIPDSVKSIHPAFNGTSNLESITLPFIGRSEDNTTNNGFGYIFGNNSYPNSYNAGGFHIPAGLKEVNITGGQSIPAYAFYQVSSLKQLGMPSSVTVIGDFAFYGTSISSIEIPRTVTHIGTYAFSENPNLLTVSFQTNSQLTVMDYAFNGATGLTQIEIPKRVISLDGTFQHAKNLTLLTFETGSQLEHVGYMSFGNTLNLLTLELPKTVKTIGDYAFYKSGLNSFQIEKDSQLEHVGYMSFGNTSNLLTLELPKTVKTIGDYAFYKSGLNSFQIEEDSQLEQIGHYAFKDTVQLASFIIPNKVQMIGNQAFYNSGLKTLYFTPDSQLEEIGSSAFQETNHLSGVTIPSSITHIGTSAFENSAINEIHFASASQLEEIGASTFKGTSNLTSITLPDSLLTIGDYAFMETSFTSLIIPNNVIVIGEGVFSGMRYLENLTIPFVGGMDTHYNKESQFGYLFGLEQYLDSYDSGGYYLPLSLKEVVITGGTQIASSAFSGASQIESLSIPKSVKTIGAYAFYGMTNLKEVHIEDNSELKSIGYAAFSHANQIEKLVILVSVTSIDDYAFSNMANLTTLQFEADSQLTTIGRFAFSDSIRLESLIIPSSVTSIGSFTFSNTPKLTSIVFEPDSNLTILEDAVFSGATGLKTLTIPKSVISIKKNAFTDTPNLTTILFAADSELTTIENRAFYEAQGLERIIIPKQVIQIGNEAFYGNNHLYEVHFASGSHLEIIGHAVFYGTNITELNIPNHVITISNGAFMGMSHLEKMTLPFVKKSHYATGKTGNFGYLFGQTAYPGSYATPEYHQDSKVLFGNFQIPNTLKEVIINGDTPIAQAAFYGVNSIETMTLPFIGRDINATGTDAQLNYLFGDLSYYAELETVILTGGSKIAEHAFSRMRVEHVVIPRSVTTIEAYAFHNSALETIRFEPLSQLTHIGDYAFSGLSTLKSIHIPRNVVTLGNSAFRGSGLESITFEAGSQLTTIEDYAFQDATNLTTIEIPNRVTSIGQSAFWRANNLTTINIMPGSQLEIIGESAFRGLQQIEHIVIPSSVTTIEDYAFYDVTNVQTLTFEVSSQLITIGDYAFSGLNRVEELVLPAQLTMIGAHAFSNWYQLKTLNLPRQLESIGESAFSNLEQITHLLIPNNLDTIGNYAFLNATNLKTIVFEDASEVTTIGYAAFGGASQLESITIPYVGRTRISQGPNAQFGYLFGQDEYENSYRTIMYINDGIIYPEFYIPNTLKEVIITDITTIQIGRASCRERV